MREGGNPARQIFREADKTSVLFRYVGLIHSLDSRFRGNDEAHGKFWFKSS
jgi:hypothetical protein